MEPLLEVQDLQTTFTTRAGQVQSVRGISFAVAPGESLGIVGESGSGKSVTSMSIMRLLPSNGRISGGKVLFRGEDLATQSLKRMRDIRGAEIAMIFQDPMSSLNPLIPVGKQIQEMITEHNKISGKEAYQRTLELLEMVRVPEPEKRYSAYPHEFSGGMRQRAMIAMALACKPALLIADEPTTALDVTIQSQILKLMAGLQKEMGMSIMFITHDLGVVAELCTRVVVMYGGMVMEEALLDELFYQTAHPYTLGLLASVPRVNIDKSERLVPIPGSPPDMISPPLGCPFAPRCAYARRICHEQMPPYYQLSPTHRSMCHLLSKEAPAEQNPLMEVRQTCLK